MTAEVLQSAEIDKAIELLEACVTRMTARGWQNDAGTGEHGERCIANTLGDVAIEGTRKNSSGFKGSWLFSDSVLIAQRTLDQLISELHPCTCPLGLITVELIVPHYNDRHCAGPAAAIELYNAAIKELRGIQA